ncbi:MAG: Gfo/Idh/MocA family oxidoreductase, partial [Eubacteriaceae bacterium]|nr:Gfo/Idh/MocA family oxidoreductase [Eubacteriaceae bacterium]
MEKLKIGILATGPMAHTMADTLMMMEEVKLEAVGSRTQEKASLFAEQYGIAKAYGSYEQLVSDPEVDLVYVVSPHSHHYEHSMLALKHGKNVLCEKAFAVNYKQAKQMTDYARENNLMITEAHWVRYMPMTKRLKEVIASGIIGEITTVTANLSYVIYQNPRIVEPLLAGGALLDVGVYP